jgi:hypothetical protein
MEIQEGIVDGNMEGGFDGFYLLFNEESMDSIEDLEEVDNRRNATVELFMIQAKTTPSFAEETLNKMYISIDKIFDLNTSDIDLSKLFNPQLLERVIAFRELWKKLAPFRPVI